MLEVADISKSFKTGKGRGRIYPLTGVDLYVGDGERIGILGKSGEGKSTLANIICGYLKPDGGNVFVDERPLYDKKFNYNRRVGSKIQLIPQQPYISFDPVQKAGGAVAEVLAVNSILKEKSEIENRAAELFEDVKLDCALMNRLPSQLSGGQIQRVAIARALAAEPDVIISDEATAMLDAYSQSQIMSIFDTLSRERGIAVILISHDFELVGSFAEKAYVLKDGKLESICKYSD